MFILKLAWSWNFSIQSTFPLCRSCEAVGFLYRCSSFTLTDHILLWCNNRCRIRLNLFFKKHSFPSAFRIKEFHKSWCCFWTSKNFFDHCSYITNFLGWSCIFMILTASKKDLRAISPAEAPRIMWSGFVRCLWRNVFQDSDHRRAAKSCISLSRSRMSAIYPVWMTETKLA